MNTTPESDSTHQGTPEGPQGFFPWLRSLQITRSSSDRWLTGVAGGIAHRAGIDPLIVRGIFVVLALLGGPGILLYLAGWLLLPNHAGTIHLEELVRGRASANVVVVVVLVAIWFVGAIVFQFGSPGIGWGLMNIPGVPDWFSLSFQVLFWIAVLIGVGLLVHQLVLNHGRTQNEGPAKPAPSAPMAAVNQAAEKANTWSASYAVQYDQRKLSIAHVLISVALALLAAGGSAFAVYANGSGASTDMAIAALAAGTAVFAGSMIVAGVIGKHSGTVGLFAILGALALAVTAVIPTGASYHLLGNTSLNGPVPASVSVLGNTSVDLSLYDSQPSHNQVDISLLAGDVDILLSPNRPTTLTLDVVAGAVDAPDFGGKSPGVFVRKTIPANEDSPGEPLNVHVRLVAGTITVTK